MPYSRARTLARAHVLLAALAAFHVLPALAEPVDIKLPAQPLGAALRDFARQTGFQVAVQSELTDAKTSPSLKGKYEPADALAALLRGTGLTAYPINLNTYGIRSPATVTTVDEGSDALNEIIVTGTRASGLRAAQSPAPIQILSAESLEKAAGSPDLMNTLAQILPSLTIQGFSSEVGGNVQVKLRGLSPNHILVLIDGQRRHTTANIEVQSGSPYQGGAGVDLNYIPLAAIDHIEVLTDGAAAQYGSDAIAGVINIILKKNHSDSSIAATYGQYGKNGDGKTDDVMGNIGLEPLSGGFLSVTAEYHDHGHSDMSAVDERVINPANLGFYPNSNMPNISGYPYLNHIFGDPHWKSKLVFANWGVEVRENVQFYSNLSYGHTDAESNVNYRRPATTDYVDINGVPVYPTPFGFTPIEASRSDDYQLNGGFRGAAYSWNWNVNSGYGENKVGVYTLNSYNSGYSQSTGKPSPSGFYDGTLKATQWTTAIDINKDSDVGLAGPLNVALGSQYRRDTYGIASGDALSYQYGGGEGYNGFAPTAAGNHGRHSYAGYVDLAAMVTDALRLDVAGRFEHYSDFGDARVGKLTGRYDFNSRFALRGTVSNGFRAPSLAEEYYTNPHDGQFVQLPANGPGAVALGLGGGLQPEHSVNYSFGAVFHPTQRVSATLDLYQITVTNRIVGSGTLAGVEQGQVVSPAVEQARVLSGAPPSQQAGYSATGVYLFANGSDTRTRGADLMFDFPFDSSLGTFDASIGATYNKTTITKYASTPAALAGGNPPVSELYDLRAYSDLTTANPIYALNLAMLWNVGRLSVNLLEKIYGPSSEFEPDYGDNGGTGAGTFPKCTSSGIAICPFEYFQSKIPASATTNLDVSYHFTSNLKLTIGGLNIFDKIPPLLNSTLLAHYNSFAYGDNAGVMNRPAFSPYGINGGFYYAKVTAHF